MIHTRTNISPVKSTNAETSPLRGNVIIISFEHGLYLIKLSLFSISQSSMTSNRFVRKTIAC